MNADQFRKVIDFEIGLSVGDEVMIKWTNCGRFHAAKATVCKINEKSVIATLNEGLDTDLGGYPKGQKIKAPRLTISTMNLWSVNNRVEPLEGNQ